MTESVLRTRERGGAVRAQEQERASKRERARESRCAVDQPDDTLVASQGTCFFPARFVCLCWSGTRKQQCPFVGTASRRRGSSELGCNQGDETDHADKRNASSGDVLRYFGLLCLEGSQFALWSFGPLGRLGFFHGLCTRLHRLWSLARLWFLG